MYISLFFSCRNTIENVCTHLLRSYNRLTKSVKSTLCAGAVISCTGVTCKTHLSLVQEKPTLVCKLMPKNCVCIFKNKETSQSVQQLVLNYEGLQQQEECACAAQSAAGDCRFASHLGQHSLHLLNHNDDIKKERFYSIFSPTQTK